MIKKLFLIILLSFVFQNNHSFEVVTAFNNPPDKTSLNNMAVCLQKQLDHFLINNIYVFFVNPPKDLPQVFKNTRIKIIPLPKTPTCRKLFKFANNNLAGKRIIIANPNVYFDDSLFKLNYYPLANHFMLISSQDFVLNQEHCPAGTKPYSCCIFAAPTKVNIPEELICGSKESDTGIEIIARNTDGVIVTNPALDILVYKYSSTSKTVDEELQKNLIPAACAQKLHDKLNDDNSDCPQIGLPFCHLDDFKLNWDLVRAGGKILLYAGNMHPDNPPYCTPAKHPGRDKFACLSLKKNNATHLIHNLNDPLPLPDNSVDIYQAEDIFEHLPYDALTKIINEIYRVLKPNGVCRISMPDYRCDILKERSQKDGNGKIIFDPFGGGQFVNGKVVNGGHLWFPVLENTTLLLNKTLFNKPNKIKFLHYYNAKNKSVTNKINYEICYVRRTPDHDGRVSDPYRVMSIIVDLIK